jgi:hypothetical protein
LRILSQQVEVHPTVGIGVQNKLPRIPTLGYVVRNINGNHARQSSHGQQK